MFMTDDELQELAGKIAGCLQENPHVGKDHCDDPLPRLDEQTREHEGISAAAVLRLVPGASRAPEPPRCFRESALHPIWVTVRNSLEHLDVERFRESFGLLLAMLATPAHKLRTSHESKGGDVAATLRAGLEQFTSSPDPMWPAMPPGEAGLSYVGMSNPEDTAWQECLNAVAEVLGELVLQNPEGFQRIQDRGISCLQLLRQLPAHDRRPVGWNQPAEGISLHLSKLQRFVQPVEEVAAGYLPRHEQFRSAARVLLRLATTPAVELAEATAN